MNVIIRKFRQSDIPNKVRWINNPLINKYLHYDLPLSVEKTETWFHFAEHRTDRFDAIIEVDNVPAGIIGLLSIDNSEKKAEFYITIGEPSYLGKGVAFEASIAILKYAFFELCLNEVWLSTEAENASAIRLYERLGFIRTGVFPNGKGGALFSYSMKWYQFSKTQPSYIYPVGFCKSNRLFIKREDLLPFSFGGNKARKAAYFFNEIDSDGYDCVVTYGSSSSNHCRVVSNMAAVRKMPCYIISPEESSTPTFNSKMMSLFGAEITVVPVNEVHDTIEGTLNRLYAQGEKPYFIPGGGHGVLGTQAYVDCYKEIKEYERASGVFFDYIFLASGTGTTQAGLVCGQLIYGDVRRIVGISIARKNPYGCKVVSDSVREYLVWKGKTPSDTQIDEATVFNDSYICGGYGKTNSEVESIISKMLINHGIPMDNTYTGKAYAGMLRYLDRHNISGRNILFLHTGGTPLFFDDMTKTESSIQ